MTHEPLGPDIFYPGSPAVLEQLTKELLKDRETDPHRRRTVVIPHGWYESIGPLAAAAWGAVSWMQPRVITLLLPVHTPEQEDSITTVPVDRVNHPLGSHPVVPVQEVSTDQRYLLEEPALDNSLPMIWKLFGEVPLRVFFISGTSSRLAGQLARLLRSLDTPNTLYAASTNMTGVLSPDVTAEHLVRVLELLGTLHQSSHAPLLELFRKNMISPCGITILEALRRTGILKGAYQILGQNTSATHGGRCTGYAGCIG